MKQYSPSNTRKAPRDFAQELNIKLDKTHGNYRHKVYRKRKLYNMRGKTKRRNSLLNHEALQKCWEDLQAYDESE